MYNSVVVIVVSMDSGSKKVHFVIFWMFGIWLVKAACILSTLSIGTIARQLATYLLKNTMLVVAFFKTFISTFPSRLVLLIKNCPR